MGELWPLLEASSRAASSTNSAACSSAGQGFATAQVLALALDLGLAATCRPGWH
jgi:hypothetical protein